LGVLRDAVQREIHVVIGVGLLEASASLGLLLGRLPVAAVVLAGIAGGYPGADAASGATEPGDVAVSEPPVAVGELVRVGEQIEVGELVRVHEEVLGDCGAWDGVRFLQASELGMAQPLGAERVGECLRETVWWGRCEKLRRGRGCTVMGCTGSAGQARERRSSTGAVVESMEGAALLRMAAMWGVEAVQIRAVSNVAGPRDRAAWKVAEALEALREFFADGPEA
jgi:futalosine hydrolase